MSETTSDPTRRGRRPIGERPMTSAERQARRRRQVAEAPQRLAMVAEAERKLADVLFEVGYMADYSAAFRSVQGQLRGVLDALRTARTGPLPDRDDD